ncbi:MAG: S41 family peptidase [Clostridiales Family XIII bacterium]|jgi:carboxyl-terminal processing protease|nr:S41 family peptidase [Clostridiales Family XIII bacterium]
MLIIKKRNFTFLLAVAFLAGAALFGAGLKICLGVAGNAHIVPNAVYEEYETYKENYGRLIDFDAYIRKNYYQPVPEGALETGAYKGMFASLGDRYTVYYTADEYRRQAETTQGEFSGIGATVTMGEDGYMSVIEVLPGGAAEQEGLLAGDVILAIDGASYEGRDLNGAVALLHGEEGSEVTLLLRRGEEEFEKKLVRAKIVTPSVSSEIFEDSNIGYIRLHSFANRTAEDFAAALRDMEEKRTRGLIIDLRDNSGGLVDRGVEIADMLLNAGTVATLRSNDAEAESKTYTTKDGATSLPYVLIVNGDTASTSEILAGAIKDNRGGRIVGTQTTGKGILQRLERFAEGDGARITVAQYFTPNGDAVNGVGITPDFIVDDPDPSGDGADPQLEKAIELLTGGAGATNGAGVTDEPGE